jgi:Tfp pilus assembly protein PilW
MCEEVGLKVRFLLKSNKKISGLSLVELLVASTISILVIGMSVTVFASAKKNYVAATTSANANVDQLSVKRILYRSIRTAGISCSYGASITNFHDSTADDIATNSFLLDSSNIRVGKVSSLAGVLDNPGVTYEPNTNYIMVKTETSSSKLVDKVENSNVKLEFSDNLSDGDYLALCTDDSVDLVKVESNDSESDSIELVQNPSNSYDPGDYVGKYQVTTFYTAETGRVDKDGQLIYALYVYIQDGQNVVNKEVIEGVKNLKVNSANVSDGNVTWEPITSDEDFDRLNAKKALQIQFTLNNYSYKKTIFL